MSVKTDLDRIERALGDPLARDVLVAVATDDPDVWRVDGKDLTLAELRFYCDQHSCKTLVLYDKAACLGETV